MNTDLIKYYKDRANEYEKIYSKPERQNELTASTKTLQEIFKSKNVFEIACGTGYWTEKIAGTANSIIATDINEAVITIAKQKNYPKNNVTFEIVDVFNYSSNIKHESLFAGFLWSHIKLQEMLTFLKTITELVKPGGTIVFMDSIYVEGSNHTITQTDEFGNTFQTRKLDDGTQHLVLKNFPTEKYLIEILGDLAQEIKYIDLKYYWLVVVTKK